MSHLSRFILCAAILTSSANAALLTLGTHSGSIIVTAQGYNTGPGGQPIANQNLPIPANGFVSAEVYANPNSAGIGQPSTFDAGPQTGAASASVSIGSVVNDSLSLSAASRFQLFTGQVSGQVGISTFYTFEQQVVITTAVVYTLELNVTRPKVQNVPNSSGGSNFMPIPGISFTGPGISDSLSGPYMANGFDTTQQAYSQTFTGVLGPGTYSFDSSFGASVYYIGNQPSDDETAGVSATLSVTALPEPASIVALPFVIAFGMRRRLAI